MDGEREGVFKLNIILFIINFCFSHMWLRQKQYEKRNKLICWQNGDKELQHGTGDTDPSSSGEEMISVTTEIL